MLIRDILCEGPEQDIQAGRKAMKAAITVAHHAFANPNQGFKVKLRGEDCIGFRADSLGLIDYAMLLVAFAPQEKDAIGLSGTFIRRLHPFKGMDRIIVVHGLTEVSPDAVKGIVNSTGFLTVFAHEMIHLLDDLQGRDASRSIDYKNSSQYLNDPGELNAFYHTACNNLVALIVEARANPDMLRDLMDLYGFNGNFTHDLVTLIHANGSMVRRFLEHLRQRNRKALLKRLYKLHQKLMELVKASGQSVAA